MKCRLCDNPYSQVNLIKYSTRHYAHAECALRKWGASFFDRLTPYQARRMFPYMVAVRFGVERELVKRAGATPELRGF